MIGAKEKRQRFLWDADNYGEGPTSLSILLDWLTTGDNYKNFKGGDKQSGISKKGYSAIIIEKMKEYGIRHRKVADVLAKIGKIEADFKKAMDWLANTGQGITNEESLKRAVEQICPQFYLLQDVMGDRHSARPLLTNEEQYNNDMDDIDEDREESNSIVESSNSIVESSPKASPERSSGKKRTFLQIVEEHRLESLSASNEIELKKLQLEEKKFKLHVEEVASRKRKEDILIRLEVLRSRKIAVEELNMSVEQAETLFPIE